MYCRNCGKEIREGSSFCRYCGAAVRGAAQPQDGPQAEPKAAPRKKPRAAVIAAALAVVVVIGAAVGGVLLTRQQQEKIAQAQADAAAAQQQLEQAQADAAAAQQQLEQAQAEAAAAEQERAQAQAEAEAAQQQAAQAQASVPAVTRQAQAELAQVEAQSAQLETLFDNAASQAEMNRYSGELFTLWDDEINVLWAHLKGSMDETAFDALTDEQLDWIAQKEAAIAAAGSEVAGGSMEPMVRSLTGLDWTRERVYYLMDYLP